MKASQLFAVVLVLLAACREPDAPDRSQAGWSVMPNAYAEHFQVQVRGEARRVLVFGPGGRTDTIAVYALGTTTDPGTAGPPIPLHRVAVVSTTHLSFFTALGRSNAVVGAAHTDQVRDPVMMERVRNGAVAEIARADGLDREKLIALAPQAVFDYPFGRDPKKGADQGTTIAVTEYLEKHPLGRAEWIRFFGLMLGETQRADSIFNAIAHRYRTLRDMNLAINNAPTVFFGSHWDQTWFAPSGSSYMATLITDAGGRYWFADSLADENIPVSLEHVLVAATECDNFGMVMAKEGKVDPRELVGGDTRLASLDAVRSGGFVGNSLRSDLFGKALLEPDIILHDLRCIFHPRSCKGYRPTYFFPVGQ